MLNILIILADKMSINRRFEDITSWSEIWMKASFIEIITEEAAASKRHFFTFYLRILKQVEHL